MINGNLAGNGLSSRKDLENAFLEMLTPYMKRLSPGKALVDPGTTAATFSERAAGLEGFSRLLWGAVPFLKGTKDSKTATELAGTFLTGISNGTDPAHGEFWGVPSNYDQLLVEMAAFAYALFMVPELLWEPLEKKEKQRFSNWLGYINKRDIPDCNWIFFRILVNAALVKLGVTPEKPELFKESLKLADKFYLDERGWYNDGYPDKRRARDYYIPWAMHFYGLVFAAYCEDLYPAYAERYRERALEYATDFQAWFDRDGNALPFGRSLTYRFAQSAFWGALPLAFRDDRPEWEHARHLYASNMRWWFSQPMFDGGGLLSVGYRYPNQYMAERYNSANSPLWAFKAFAPLAAGEDHPFWKAAEKEPAAAAHTVQQGSGMHIITSKHTGHHYALNAGQWTPGISNEHLHMAEKYSKFAYSTYFGFNVVTDGYGIDKLAADNMLLLGENEEEAYYRYRKSSVNHAVTENYLFSEWQPFDDVTVGTWLVPVKEGRWHIRVHRLVTDRKLVSAEGSFPLGFGNEYYPVPDAEKTRKEGEAWAKTGMGTSRIHDLGGNRNGYVIPSSPNANIMFPRSVVPVLKGSHEPGTSVLACAVSAHPDPDNETTIPEIRDFIKVLPEDLQSLLMEK